MLSTILILMLLVPRPLLLYGLTDLLPNNLLKLSPPLPGPFHAPPSPLNIWLTEVNGVFAKTFRVFFWVKAVATGACL